jgi:tRNA dimethylallyltransferase
LTWCAILYLIWVVVANKEKVLAVLGATCTGKSECALWLAREVGGEIVNADSMQVYKHFDIGSAKPDLEARQEVVHHLIDIVDPEEEFNAALFKEAADRAIEAIWLKNKVPIVVGGTGLYLRALFHGLFAAEGDAATREKLKDKFRENPASVYEELKRVDAEYASRISPNDRVRVVRALEIYSASGMTMSQWQRTHGFKQQRYEVYKVGLKKERVGLYNNINRRVDNMLEAGWVEEVKALLKAGYSSDAKPFLSIGYRDILLYLRSELSYAEMVVRTKQETRHYAKRQVTWFAKEKDIDWFEHPEEKKLIKDEVRQFLQ